MPDLMTHYSWWCFQNEYFTTEIPGSNGNVYNVTWMSQMGWDCDCKGFKYRKDCRHIREAEKLRCTFGEGAAWGSPEPDDAFVREEPGDRYSPVHCPKCGSPACSVKWMA